MRPAKLLLALAALALVLLLIFCPCHNTPATLGGDGPALAVARVTNEVVAQVAPVKPAATPPPAPPVATVTPAAVVPSPTVPPTVPPVVPPAPIAKVEPPPAPTPPRPTPPVVPAVPLEKPVAPALVPEIPKPALASNSLRRLSAACTTASLPGLIDISSRVPEGVAVGEVFTNEITLLAYQCAGKVLVYGNIPTGASLISADAAIDRSGGGDWKWLVSELDAGEARTLRLVLRATQEGNVGGCAAVQAEPRLCGSVVIGRPALSLEKSGPATAQLGQPVNYKLTVRNNGSSAARKVVLVDIIPAGLGGPGEKRFDLGDLGPGETKSIVVAATATTAGRQCNVATVRAANVAEVRAEACTRVVTPAIKLTKTGPAEQWVGKEAVYQITVSNTGEADLSGVVLTDVAPAATRALKASDQGSLGASGATWSLGMLKAGENRKVELSLTTLTPGRYCNEVRVSTAEGLQEKAEACTLWKGVSAILFEVVDDPDPIQLGEETHYTLRVTNQGQADLTNVRVQVECPTTIQPLPAAQATIAGQSVTFTPVPVLGRQKSVTFHLPARGVREGDGRLKATLLEDQLLSPVIEEESTRVY